MVQLRIIRKKRFITTELVLGGRSRGHYINEDTLQQKIHGKWTDIPIVEEK